MPSYPEGTRQWAEQQRDGYKIFTNQHNNRKML